MSHKILFSNIGYARGIDGSLKQHLYRFGRHIYCQAPVQQEVLKQLKQIMVREDPDLCCFVEIDQGSFHSAYFNQMQALIDDVYLHHDIADKYGTNSSLSRMPLHVGKSNGFLAKHEFSFERLYLRNGTKRLIYRITLKDNLHLIFAHFSLKQKIRALQFQEIAELVQEMSGEVIILADFNTWGGFSELQELLKQCDMTILNKEDEHTFVFHKKTKALDLCLCSNSLAERLKLRIIPQPFSDHDALLLEV